MPNEAASGLPDPKADAEREERIRQRAYQLWKEDGAPEGRSEEYWHRAQQLIDRETQATSSSEPER